eukprot:11211010-Alexandrium_andersonii.AAC.1
MHPFPGDLACCMGRGWQQRLHGQRLAAEAQLRLHGHACSRCEGLRLSLIHISEPTRLALI